MWKIVIHLAKVIINDFKGKYTAEESLGLLILRRLRFSDNKRTAKDKMNICFKENYINSQETLFINREKSQIEVLYQLTFKVHLLN